MKTSTLSFVSLLILCLLFNIDSTRAQYYFSQRHLTRGADTAEIYISCEWYVDTSGIIWNGLFRSVDNGKSLSLQRKTKYWEECGMILGDSVSGALFQYPMHHQDTFGISYDYGTTFEEKYFNGVFYSAAGCTAGEIYISGWDGFYRSIDYGNTFTLQSTEDSLSLREVGTLPGELYCYRYPYFGGPLGLAFSSDYGQTFTVSFIDFPGVPTYDECMIYRGTEPGEIYFVIWYSWMTIYLFHTFDYGQTITFQSQLPPAIGEETYTAGRTPGSFYHVQREVCGTPPYVNSCLYIRFSRDYGVTFTEYFHFLDSTYTGISHSFQESSEILCYPNPASDQLTIRLENTWFTDIALQLVDLTGRIQLSSTIPKNKDNVILDLSTVKSGIYFVKLFSTGKKGGKVIGVKKVVVE